jgi:hypothetical protein
MQTNPVFANEWSENFALLEFAGLQMLIPQTDIYSLEPAVDMSPPSGISFDSVGEFVQSGHVWSLYALSADLDVLGICPETYRIAILFKNVQPVFGLLCEQVDTIKRSEISIHPIPDAMQNKYSPILALALHDSVLGYISSASALSSLFLY